MELEITFPGGKRVDAAFMDQIIRTDQSRQSGGDGSAPEPYLLFLASLGTCAGIYVLGFCQSRGLSTDGVRLTQKMDWDAATHRLAKISLEIHVPPDFPEKYRGALVRAADQCAVKKTLLSPPDFHIDTVVDGAEQAEAAAG
jgi:ribosomal protein S12 methylthiotransferase accessory factor